MEEELKVEEGDECLDDELGLHVGRHEDHIGCQDKSPCEEIRDHVHSITLGILYSVIKRLKTLFESLHCQVCLIFNNKKEREYRKRQGKQ